MWCGRQPAAEARARQAVHHRSAATPPALCPASPAGLLPARAAQNQPRGPRAAPAPSLLDSPSTHSQLPPRSTGLWVLCAGLSPAIRENPLFPHCAGQGVGFEVPAPEPTCLCRGPAAHRPGLLPSSTCGLCSTQHPSCLPSVHPSVRQRLSHGCQVRHQCPDRSAFWGFVLVSPSQRGRGTETNTLAARTSRSLL